MDPRTSLIEQIASDDVLQQAYDWLCARRKEYSANNDVWDIRWRWVEVKPQLQADLVAGWYRLGALERRAGKESIIELWSSLDALVLKATALVLYQHLKPHLSSHCYHLAGTGGAKGAVRAVANHLRHNTFVYRTDVKSYYASIHPLILFEMLADHIKDLRVLDLLWNYIYRTVYDGGYYQDICHGICRGCPLSPLIGTLYLKQLDDRMARTGLFYARFMDDVVILAPTRWKLRAAIKTVNQTLGELKLERHPEKTFIGRISRGFDFLGYAFTPSRLGVAPKTFERFGERMTRLYELGAGPVRIGEYARRWWRWVRAGLGVKVMGAAEINLIIRSFCSFDHEYPFHGRRPSVGTPKVCPRESVPHSLERTLAIKRCWRLQAVPQVQQLQMLSRNWKGAKGGGGRVTLRLGGACGRKKGGWGRRGVGEGEGERFCEANLRQLPKNSSVILST